MYISIIPTELFVKILEYIPLENASTIMQVNKKWHREYRGTIQRQHQVKFKKLLYSNWWDWSIPSRLIDYFRWHEFLISKLRNFCDNFGIFLIPELHDIQESLRLELKQIDKERKVIDKLMDTHEANGGFEGWFPDWLWEKHKNNRYKSGTNIMHMNRIYVLIRKLNEGDWEPLDRFL